VNVPTTLEEVDRLIEDELLNIVSSRTVDRSLMRSAETPVAGELVN
jgi:hypothetical protein